jgi:hypothetical protein
MIFPIVKATYKLIFSEAVLTQYILHVTLIQILENYLHKYLSIDGCTGAPDTYLS